MKLAQWTPDKVMRMLESAEKMIAQAYDLAQQAYDHAEPDSVEEGVADKILAISLGAGAGAGATLQLYKSHVMLTKASIVLQQQDESGPPDISDLVQ